MAELFIIPEKKLNKIVATTPEVQAALQAQAEVTAAQIKAKIAPHSKTGTFFESIHISRGAVDRLVYSDDPNAVYKDYDHVTQGGEFVQGIGAFRGASRGRH